LSSSSTSFVVIDYDVVVVVVADVSDVVAVVIGDVVIGGDILVAVGIFFVAVDVSVVVVVVAVVVVHIHLLLKKVKRLVIGRGQCGMGSAL